MLEKKKHACIADACLQFQWHFCFLSDFSAFSRFHFMNESFANILNVYWIYRVIWVHTRIYMDIHLFILLDSDRTSPESKAIAVRPAFFCCWKHCFATKFHFVIVASFHISITYTSFIDFNLMFFIYLFIYLVHCTVQVNKYVGFFLYNWINFKPNQTRECERNRNEIWQKPFVYAALLDKIYYAQYVLVKHIKISPPTARNC